MPCLLLVDGGRWGSGGADELPVFSLSPSHHACACASLVLPLCSQHSLSSYLFSFSLLLPQPPHYHCFHLYRATLRTWTLQPTYVYCFSVLPATAYLPCFNAAAWLLPVYVLRIGALRFARLLTYNALCCLPRSSPQLVSGCH